MCQMDPKNYYQFDNCHHTLSKLFLTMELLTVKKVYIVPLHPLLYLFYTLLS